MDRLACVSIPAFPLQILLRRHPEWSGYPAAVIAEEKPQAKILWVNKKARQAGVLPGLRLSAGSSLAIHLRAGVVPSAEVEKKSVALAERLMRFTPKVEPSTRETGIFWLSGTGLRLLYPALTRWAGSIHASIEEAGFLGNVAVGLTRFGVYAAARARRGVMVFEDLDRERAAARETPLGCLDLDPDFRDALFKLGIKTLGALIDLPAAGLLERFGPEACRLHRMASNDLWSPIQPYQPEEVIREKMILDDPEAELERLIFWIKRLLHPLLTALAARREALSGLILRLLIDRAGWREERVAPAAPTLDPLQVIELVRLRLESIEISSGVEEIELRAERIPATSEQLRFFTDRPRRDLEAGNRALARLRAEFGDAAVVRAKLADGHLPEARFTWEPLDQIKLAKPKPETAKTLVRRILAKPVPLPSQPQGVLSLRARNTSTSHEFVLAPRYGAVEKLSGPYVLSGGWWNREIHREYYFAETRRGDLLWVFYDRVRGKWFLQGRVE